MHEGGYRTRSEHTKTGAPSSTATAQHAAVMCRPTIPVLLWWITGYWPVAICLILLRHTSLTWLDRDATSFCNNHCHAIRSESRYRGSGVSDMGKPCLKQCNFGYSWFKTFAVFWMLYAFFFLGHSPASEFYMPTFRNTVPSSWAGIPTCPCRSNRVFG